jgi:Ser/Thr protein kinase RdoA (MazF antagonist)
MVSETQATRIAQSALAHWGGGAARLISIRENVVFDVISNDGRRMAMRLHRQGYRSRSAIEAELVWCTRLAESGFPAPAPVLCLDGALTVQVSNTIVSCVTWIEGGPCDAPDFTEIGALVARLHSAPQPDLPMLWDVNALLGSEPAWGRFWENPQFTAEDRVLIATASELARRLLDERGYDTGAIHGDLLRENILCDAHGLALIDFDDCGQGYYLYDLSTALIQSFEVQDFNARCDALLAGYKSIRPLVHAGDLPVFIMLRAFASAGWILSRGEINDDRVALYAKRARLAAPRVLEEFI